MKRHLNPYIIPGTCMLLVLLVAVSVFYRNSGAVDSDAAITVEEVREIALNDAGEKMDQVTFTKTSLEKKSGTLVYDVDFYTNEKQYDYEINAMTGSIREKESVVHKKTVKKESAPVETTKDNALIGVEKAQAAALKDAGFTADQVTFTRTTLETDDSKTKYEIEFTQGTKEYDYEVDAYTGVILESDIDVDDDPPAGNKVTKDGSGKTTSSGSISDDDPDDDDDLDDDDDPDDDNDDHDDPDDDDDHDDPDDDNDHDDDND